MKTELSQFQFILFPGKFPEKKWREHYIETYRLWREVWTATFDELDGNATLYSDDFCRQSIIGSIFREKRCVGIGMFHWVDFSLPTARHDSWFKAWPDSAIEKLLTDGHRVLVGSNVTVDPAFRGDLQSGLRLRNIILGLMSRTLISTSGNVMAGTARKNRGVHRASYSAGATHLESGTLHGVDVDFVAFYQKNIQKLLPFEFSVESLWRNRIQFFDTQEALNHCA